MKRNPLASSSPPPEASTWCDFHNGWVDEDKAHPFEGGAESICGACYEEQETKTARQLGQLQRQQILEWAMAAVADTRLSIDDRAAIYSVLHTIQLHVNRALKPVKDEFIAHMVRGEMRRLGPLSIRTSAIDPAYPCNDPGNWEDDGVQQAMAELRATPRFREYIRVVPAHLEIDKTALGTAMTDMPPREAARELYGELNRCGWRTEEGRRLSLAVKEAQRKGEAA